MHRLPRSLSEHAQHDCTYPCGEMPFGSISRTKPGLSRAVVSVVKLNNSSKQVTCFDCQAFGLLSWPSGRDCAPYFVWSMAPHCHAPSLNFKPRTCVRPEAAFGKFRSCGNSRHTYAYLEGPSQLLSPLCCSRNTFGICRHQSNIRIPCPSNTRQTSTRRSQLHAADAGQLDAADLPPEEPQEPSYSVQVFPRIREKDPYRCLFWTHVHSHHRPAVPVCAKDTIELAGHKAPKRLIVLLVCQLVYHI